MATAPSNLLKEPAIRRTGTPRLGEFLHFKGLLRVDQLEAALAEQMITQEKIGVILSRSGFVSRRALVDAILETNPSRIYGEELFSGRVPAQVLLELKTMVVAETERQVFVATLGSERQVAAELSPYYPDLKLEFVAGNHEHVNNYLDKLRSLESSDDALFERLMRRAMRDNVSDVHIIPRYSSYSVFFRRLGVRHLAHEGSLDEYNTLSARIKDLARMDLAERRIPQDGPISLENDGKLIDLRVATTPVGTAEYIVLRILDSDRVQPSLDGVGITRLAEWRKGVSRPNGLCLICGPTGSGKTTTLNASIKEMDRFGRAIFSMEDPVEYRIPYVGQVGANAAVGLDFARGIRAFMRLDPDVIVIGEVRDAETARNAVKAAETGHLVLATLHTSSIYGAVSRLRDLDVPAHELRYLLRSILVQNLMRTTCSHCHGVGCPVCNNTGFTGRTVISEACYFSGELEVGKLLAGDIWWPTILDDAILKHRMGLTSAEEVIRIFGTEAEAKLGREGY
jgi:type II secretory ATPase GspE/PulE/Tfp pilus assembly ATPase PilB-like protein